MSFPAKNAWLVQFVTLHANSIGRRVIQEFEMEQYPVHIEEKTANSGLYRIGESHDCITLLLQGKRQDSIYAERLNECRPSLSSSTACLGYTNVVVAPCPTKDMESIARFCLNEVRPNALQKEEILPNVWLFSGRKENCKVILTDCAITPELEAFVYGPLHSIEVSRHRIEYHATGYKKIRKELDTCGTQLTTELAELVEQIEQTESNRNAKNCRDSISSNGRTAAAYRKLTQIAAEAQHFETTIEANRINILRAIEASGSNQASYQLSTQLRHAEMIIAQIRTDLNYLRPLLKQAHWATQFDQTRLLAELTYNKLDDDLNRRREMSRHARLTIRLTILAILFAVNQSWTVIVTLLDDLSVATMAFFMAAPIGIIIAFLYGFWRISESRFQKKNQPDRSTEL